MFLDINVLYPSYVFIRLTQKFNILPYNKIQRNSVLHIVSFIAKYLTAYKMATTPHYPTTSTCKYFNKTSVPPLLDNLPLLLIRIVDPWL